MELGHTQNKRVINRLSRAIGHLESVRKMVKEGKDCTDILIQLSAVLSAVNNTGKLILRDHIRHCITEALINNDEAKLDNLDEAIDRFV